LIYSTSLDGLDEKEIPACIFRIKSLNPNSYVFNLIRMVSIIIPTYNESKIIGGMLDRLCKMVSPSDEIIVVDGLSEDHTKDTVRRYSRVKLLLSPKRGRAIQMNLGASQAQNRYLLFLHADTLIDMRSLELLKQEINSKKIIWGWFPIKLSSNKLIFRLIEKGANLRARVTRTPLGDYGIFVEKELFQKIGGFPEIPIMEDIEFVKRIKRAYPVGVEIKSPIQASARRFEKYGIIKTLLVMWTLSPIYIPYTT
jgi:rSAM/selenodomain-associated transferase 2